MASEAPAKLPALPSTPEELTGAQRAAILLIALGVETAGFVLPLLPDAAVERISVEVARFRNVPGDLVDDVLLRFRQESGEPNPLAQGGKAVAREMLLNALGADRTEQVMNKVVAATELSAFQLLQTVEPAQVARFLHGEHPQTAALILGRIAPNRASRIVAELDETFRAEVLFRLGTMGDPAPELIAEVEAVIFEELGPSFGGGAAIGGAERVAAILNNSGRTVGAALMETLRERSPELAGSVKGFMFVFDDLLHVSGRSLQRVLTEVDQRDLALALKGASEELKDKVLENVSERVRASILEEIEVMGPVRVSDVEEAQQRVVEAAQTLDEAGEIELTSPTAAAEAMLA